MAIFETTAAPTYLGTCRGASQFPALGLSNCAIAQALNTTDKTVAKAVRRMEGACRETQAAAQDLHDRRLKRG